MIKVAFKTLGCKVNTYETNVMRDTLPHNFKIVDFNEKADVYIINTCSVTHVADRKSRQMIHRARKMNKNALVIAAGCFADNIRLFPNDNIKEKNIIYVNNKEKNKTRGFIWNIIKKELKNKKDKNEAVKDIKNIKKIKNTSENSNNVRGFLKIEDGCNNFCSYCLIPYLRGRAEVREKIDVLKDAKKMAKNGIKEIVLTGINITAAGEDYILDIIKNISRIKGILRIRLGSIEESLISDNFLRSIKDDDLINNKFCPEFHLSLQSGSDKILKLMNRHYCRDEYFDKVSLVRKYFPSSSITTDIIVGFPGESEKDFNDTLDFIKKVKFFAPHIFPYSKRKGTKAYDMEDLLTDAEKQKRTNVLINESKKITKEIINKKLKDVKKEKRLNILAEEVVETKNAKFLVGHTKDYIKVYAYTGSKNNSKNASYFIGKEIEVDIINNDLL